MTKQEQDASAERIREKLKTGEYPWALVVHKPLCKAEMCYGAACTCGAVGRREIPEPPAEVGGPV